VVVSSTECAPGAEASPSSSDQGQEKGPKHYFSKWDLFTTPGRRPASEEREDDEKGERSKKGNEGSSKVGAAESGEQQMPTPSPRLIDRITVNNFFRLAFSRALE